MACPPAVSFSPSHLSMPWISFKKMHLQYINDSRWCDWRVMFFQTPKKTQWMTFRHVKAVSACSGSAAAAEGATPDRNCLHHPNNDRWFQIQQICERMPAQNYSCLCLMQLNDSQLMVQGKKTSDPATRLFSSLFHVCHGRNLCKLPFHAHHCTQSRDCFPVSCGKKTLAKITNAWAA